jgi:hypothetical protein
VHEIAFREFPSNKSSRCVNSKISYEIFLSVEKIRNQCFGSKQQKCLQQAFYKFDKEKANFTNPLLTKVENRITER